MAGGNSDLSRPCAIPHRNDIPGQKVEWVEIGNSAREMQDNFFCFSCKVRRKAGSWGWGYWHELRPVTQSNRAKWTHVCAHFGSPCVGALIKFFQKRVREEAAVRSAQRGIGGGGGGRGDGGCSRVPHSATGLPASQSAQRPSARSQPVIVPAPLRSSLTVPSSCCRVVVNSAEGPRGGGR
jgi:hypothetical protein